MAADDGAGFGVGSFPDPVGEDGLDLPAVDFRRVVDEGRGAGGAVGGRDVSRILDAETVDGGIDGIAAGEFAQLDVFGGNGGMNGPGEEVPRRVS